MVKAEIILDDIIKGIPEYCRENQMKLFTYIYYKVACMLEYDEYAAKLIGMNLGGFDRERAEECIIRPASTIECIKRGKGVCSGYANVLYYLLNKVGIPTKIIIAKSIHEWNQVFINGKWYNCDLTNDRDFIVQGLKCPHFLTSNSDDCNYTLRPPTSEFNECNETISDELQEQLIDEVRAYFELQQKNQSIEDQEEPVINHSKLSFIDKIKSKFFKGGRKK